MKHKDVIKSLETELQIYKDALKGMNGGSLDNKGTTTQPIPVMTENAVVTTAVVIICYNRPEYLQRTVSSVLKFFPISDAELFFSQDGNVNSVTQVIQKTISDNPNVRISHLNHRQDSSLRSG
jgi:hypothetical protein